MTYQPEYNISGGRVSCDARGCGRTRLNYCVPDERDTWDTQMFGMQVLDYCPAHSAAPTSGGQGASS